MTILFRLIALFLAVIGIAIFVLVFGFGYVFVTRDHDPMWIFCMIVWGFIGAVSLFGSCWSFLTSRPPV